MGIIRIIAVFSFCFIALIGLAQDRYDIEEKDGRRCYVYIVEQGNTVYGITRLFKIDEKDLYAANPGLNTNLTLGQKIWVPVEKSAYKQEDLETNTVNNVKEHKVARGETFYGLSRKYGVTIDEIKAVNPGLTELRNGQKIKIPVKGGETIQKDPIVEKVDENKIQNNQEENIEVLNREYEWNDSVVHHKVLAHETLYSISRRYMVSVDTLKKMNNLRNNRLSTDQELIIPLKQIKIREVLEKPIPPKDTVTFFYENSEIKEIYNVTLMLPLFLDKNAAHLEKGSLTSPKEILARTKIALDFYAGFILAADSLEKAGVNLNVQVLDTKGDSATVTRLLQEKSVENADLIIGPFFGKAIPPVASFAKKHGIHQVIPFSAGSKVLYDNPYVSKFVTSNAVLIDGTMEYVKDRYEGTNIVLIKSTASNDKFAYERTRTYLQEHNVSYVEKPLSTTDMRSYFKKDEVNVVLAPSSNQVFATNLFTGLNKTLNKFGYKDSTVIHLFGTDNWDRFEGIKMKYKTRMNFHFASPIYVDWNDPNVVSVVANYRRKFETDPSKYALHGFDISMYYVSALELFGTGFCQYFQSVETTPTVNRIQMKQLGATNGFENSAYFIQKYSPNYLKYLMR